MALLTGAMIRIRLIGTPLWLDEAQTVALSGNALGDIAGELERDGHPPVFYWLLHGWMELVGSSDRAVRAVPALFGLGVVVALWAGGRRIGGASLGLVAAAVGALTPFLVRYATEARMYSLVTLLSLLWWLTIETARDRDRPLWYALLAALTGLLVLTHYWSFFLLAAWAAAELVAWWRAGRPVQRLRPLAAVATGSLAFLVWLGGFLAQLRHTGTPWADAPNPAAVFVNTLFDLAGGWVEGEALALAVILGLLMVVGFAGRRLDGPLVELDLRGRPEIRQVAWLAVGPLLVGAAAITVLDSAFAARYAAVSAGFLVLLVARGIVTLGPVAGLGALVVTSTLGAVGSLRATGDLRSQGLQVATAINAEHRQGQAELVVACPDQLGPAVARYADEEVEVLAYPTLDPADTVDWVDYAARNRSADPAAVADEVSDRAGDDVWLVGRDGYLTFGTQCEQLRTELEQRGVASAQVVAIDSEAYESMWLIHVELR